MSVSVTKSGFNVREKLKQLQKPIGLKGSELMRAETAQEARDLVSAGRKNLIINGDFKISQRGDYTSSAVTAGHDSYWLDRWMSLKNGTTSTVQRVTRTVNGISQYAARIECTVATTGASGIFGFSQRVELSSIPVGRTLTASAWVRTNHPYVGFRTNTFQGSGGDKGVKVTPDGNWHRIYWTFDSTGTTNSSVGGDILIVAYNNTSVSIAVGDYIEIAEVQLEVGKNATEFEHRSYGEELALCQRYFLKLGGESNIMGMGSGTTVNTTNGWAVIQFPVTMRIPPTAALLGGTGVTLSTGNVYPGSPTLGTQYAGTTGTMLTFNYVSPGYTGAGQGAVLYTQNGATDGLTFNAEL